MKRSILFLAIPLAVALSGCGGSSSGTAGQGVEVDVQPPSTEVAPLATTTFTASVTSTVNTGVVWTIQEGAPGGTITSLGSYTAPGSGTVNATGQLAFTANVTTTCGVFAAQ
jgi:hypothetical protein